MANKIFNTWGEADDVAQSHQIVVYVDTGGWGYYELKDRSDASKNETYAYETIVKNTQPA